MTVIAWLWARTVKSPNPAAGGAETLSKAKDISVQGLVEAGILTAIGEKSN